MGKGLRIGTYTVSKPRRTTQHYECAAWETVIEVPAGVYSVVCYPYLPENRLGHTLYAETRGPIVGGTMRSRIGAHYSERDEVQEQIARGEWQNVSCKFSPSFQIKDEALDKEVDELTFDDLVLDEGLELDPEVIYIKTKYRSDPKKLVNGEWIDMCRREFACFGLVSMKEKFEGRYSN